MKRIALTFSGGTITKVLARLSDSLFKIRKELPFAGIRPGQKAVIASGYSENKKVAEAQRLGAGPYIQKPYKMIELAALVSFELDKYRS